MVFFLDVIMLDAIVVPVYGRCPYFQIDTII